MEGSKNSITQNKNLEHFNDDDDDDYTGPSKKINFQFKKSVITDYNHLSINRNLFQTTIIYLAYTDGKFSFTLHG